MLRRASALHGRTLVGRWPLRQVTAVTARAAAHAAQRGAVSIVAHPGAWRVAGGRHAARAIVRSFCARPHAAAPPSSALGYRTLGRVAAACLVGTGAYGAWRLRRQPADPEVEDVELPLIPEPSGQFVHPYEQWPWYRRAWFTVKRSVFLVWVFIPFLYASTCMVLFSESAWREYWLRQMLECTQNAGAAFQKFGQWLSMRPDMFPPDVIEVLSKLRSDAPAHPVEISKQLLRTRLGHEVDELFEEFESEPVASGSVGQVHRARLRAEFALDGPGGRLRQVAVKVQHPGVIDSAFMDLSIVWKVVDLSQNFLHMTLPFSRVDFDECIQSQMDFTREAFNLQQFSRNFRGEASIRFPKVSPRFVTPEVLVETWADGQVISSILEDFDNAKASCEKAISSFTEKKKSLQNKLCSILYDMNMKMMVRDNFVHGDLHGGNILFSETDDHVTVLDAGIATSLKRKNRAPFGKFLHALCSGRTDGVVELLQHFNESTCAVDMVQFRRDIQATMDKFMGPLDTNSDEPVNAADMFGEIMFSMQKQHMLLKGDVASMLFTISISEGLIRQLDPTFDVARRAVPYIIRHAPRSSVPGEAAQPTG